MPVRKGPDGTPIEEPSTIYSDRLPPSSADAGVQAGRPSDGRDERRTPDPNDAPTVVGWRQSTAGDGLNAGAVRTVAGSAGTSGLAGNPGVGGVDTPAGDQPTRLVRGSKVGRIVSDDVETEADQLPVGWLVVVGGPGKGKIAPLFFNWNRIGRSKTPVNQVVLNYGDDGISAEDHAAIVYDEHDHGFELVHRNGKNMTYLDGERVVAPKALQHGQQIQIGHTMLRFVRFCGPDFCW